MIRNMQPIWIMLFYIFFCFIFYFVSLYFSITSSKLIIFVLYYYIVTFNVFNSLLVSYAYVSIESIDSILLSSLALNAILLTSSINTLCFSFLNLPYDFNINLLFFSKFFMIFSKIIHAKIIFF